MNGILKFLLFFLIASGITAGCLWFLGGKKREYSTAVTIDAPPEKVFPYLAQAKLVPAWMDCVVDINPLSEGAVALGTKFAITKRVRGVDESFTQEVIRFQPSQIFALRARDSTGITSSIFTLESVSEKTALSYKIKATTKGFARLLVPFQDAKKRQLEMVEDALALKKLVESNLTDGATADLKEGNARGSDSVSGVLAGDSQADQTATVDSK